MAEKISRYSFIKKMAENAAGGVLFTALPPTEDQTGIIDHLLPKITLPQFNLPENTPLTRLEDVTVANSPSAISVSVDKQPALNKSVTVNPLAFRETALQIADSLGHLNDYQALIKNHPILLSLGENVHSFEAPIAAAETLGSAATNQPRIVFPESFLVDYYKSITDPKSDHYYEIVVVHELVHSVVMSLNLKPPYSPAEIPTDFLIGFNLMQAFDNLTNKPNRRKLLSAMARILLSIPFFILNRNENSPSEHQAYSLSKTLSQKPEIKKNLNQFFVFS